MTTPNTPNDGSNNETERFEGVDDLNKTQRFEDDRTAPDAAASQFGTSRDESGHQNQTFADSQRSNNAPAASQYGNQQFGHNGQRVGAPLGNSQYGSPQYGNSQYGNRQYGNSPQHGGSQYGGPRPGDSGQEQHFNVLGLIAIILAVLALGVCWIPLFGLAAMVPAAIAIVLGIIGLLLDRYRGRRGLAIAGLIGGVIAMFLSFILPILTGAAWVFGTLIDQMDETKTYPTSTQEPYETPDETYEPEPTIVDPPKEPQPSATTETPVTPNPPKPTASEYPMPEITPGR